MTDDDDSIVRSTLGRIGRASATRRRAVFIGVVILLGISLVGAVGVQMSLGMELYIEDDSDTMEDWDEIQEDFDKGNVVFVEIEADDETDLYEPENTEQISELYQNYYDDLKHDEDIEAASLVTSFAHPIKAGHGEIDVENDTRTALLESVNHSFNEHRSNMGVIANLHPDIQEHEDYDELQDQLDEGEYPVVAKNGTEMFEDGSTAIIMIQYGDVDIPEDEEGDFFGFLPPSEDEIIEQQIRETTNATGLPDEWDVTFTGSPIFEEAAFGLMLPEMITLFAAAFLIILFMVVLIMRSRLRKTRRVAIPLTTTLVALIAMLGMMGFVGFNFNAIMLGVMPVALGLGIDYGLQIQTRYVEERKAGRSPVEAAEIATQTTGYALTLALGTTAVGLGSLLAAEVPPVRQFGVTAAFSVFMAMILSVTLLIALLVTFDDEPVEAPTSASTSIGDVETRANGSGADENPTGLEGVFDKLGSGISARPLLVIVLLGALIGGGLVAYPAVDTQEDMLDYWPDIEERQDIRDLEDNVPSPNINYIIVESENDDDIYTREHFEEMQSFQHEIEDSHEDVITVMSAARAMEVGNTTVPVEGPEHDQLPPEGEEFDDELELRTEIDRPPQLGLHPDNHSDRMVIQVFVGDVEGEEERQVINSLDEAADNALNNSAYDTRVTGEMVLNRNVIENVTSGLTRTTIISFTLGMVFLGLVLRSGRESVLLVGSVAASAMALVAGGMYLLDVPWNPLTVTTASIVLGVGITYGIHIYERFREERLSGADPDTAIKTAILRKSRPVLASGATTMFGFGVLMISDFPVLANFGIAIALAMGLALLTAFVFMPAITLLLARRGYLPAGNVPEDTERTAD
ncbi:MMPL family transporter [Salinarchaeum sp. IM2453]|uniref:efflux RND transporter permease subunit n=1 Tax=Salinarchaeum sp. IM2453 TaxID=2862870 RepID=UPI001C83A2C4|nr:MMPL family transporter [Salinarchaeum sp. IM2453]QZA88138.1 MMPL family transporter [Salinarchaeum sp. IM2453]